MAVFVGLLRAVNVGGRGKVGMAELRAACEDAGLRRVATYVQSGNLVFETAKPAKAARSLVERILHERFKIDTVCVLRAADRLAAVIDRNPFPDAAAERPSLLLASLVDGKPAAGAKRALAAYEGPERLHLDEDTLYVDYVNGVGRSKLSPSFIDRALGRPSTARSWNTVNRLLELARALEA